MLVARVPFSQARAIDAAAIILAVLVAIGGLALLALPADIAALALLLPAGYVLLNAGQVVPFALVALVFSGVALARRRYRLAGIAAALTMIEPHLGLPVCIAMLVWIPAGRLTLVATLIALTAIGGLMLGLSGVTEFLTRVLPAQAGAETAYVYQYSLTYLLAALGVPSPVALIAGALSYLALLAIGVWLGRKAARELDEPTLLVYLPAACSVVAGSYVHMVDLPFAIPAALVLACSLQTRWRSVAIVALCLLAVPWIPVWITKKLFLACLFVVAALLVRLRAPVTVAAATFAAVAATIYALELAPPAPLIARTPAGITPFDLAQTAWRAWVDALAQASPAWLLVKVPIWFALIALLAAAAGALARPSRVS